MIVTHEFYAAFKHFLREHPPNQRWKLWICYNTYCYVPYYIKLSNNVGLKFKIKMSGPSSPSGPSLLARPTSFLLPRPGTRELKNRWNPGTQRVPPPPIFRRLSGATWPRADTRCRIDWAAPPSPPLFSTTPSLGPSLPTISAPWGRRRRGEPVNPVYYPVYSNVFSPVFCHKPILLAGFWQIEINGTIIANFLPHWHVKKYLTRCI